MAAQSITVSLSYFILHKDAFFLRMAPLWLRTFSSRMGHFTVVYSVTWPMNGSEAAGDLASIQTPLFLSCKSCSCDANWPSFA